MCVADYDGDFGAEVNWTPCGIRQPEYMRNTFAARCTTASTASAKRQPIREFLGLPKRRSKYLSQGQMHVENFYPTGCLVDQVVYI